MSATQPIGVDSTPVSSETAVRRQLDALAKGEIDHVTFLSNMKERFRLEPDDNWEVLSLLDQYYRRGKITLEVFRALKSGIAEYILGPQNSAPGQQSDAPTLRTVVAPPASSAPPRAAAPPPAAASSAPPPPAEVPTPVARTAVTPGGVAPGAVAPGAVAPSAARAAPAPVTTAAVPVAPRPTASARAPLPQAPVNSHFENTMQMPILTADEGAGAALARAAHADAPHHAATYTGAAAHAAPITPSREVAAAAAAVAAAHAAAEAPAPAAAAPAREVHVGELLRNRYRLDSLIGRGASGIVFEANDPFRLNLPPSGKRVALKALRTPDPRGIFINQLRQEFHHLQLLSHPNIVRAFDFDRDGGLAFFTMELLNGEHLNRVLQTRGTPLDRPYAFAIIRDVGSAVAYAHSRGIAHGDINPQNVFITSRGEVRVLGFGASNKLSGNGGAPEFEQATAMADTYRYASCEVLQGGRPDASDDLYALSCLAYLLLSGKHPFADRTSIEARAERRRPRRPAGLRYRQWQTLRAGLQIDAKKRPTDVKAWLEGMELGAAAAQLPPASELIESRAGRKGGLKWALAAVLVAALIGGGYWLYTNQDVFMSQPPTESSQAVSPGAPAPSEVAPPAASPPAAQPSAAARPGAKPPAPTPAPVAPTVARAPAPAPVAPVHKADTTPAPTPTSPPAAPIVAAPATARVAAPASTKVEMAVDTMDAAPTDSVVRVTVRRKGNLHGTTSFTWWTESGTAKPGVDFSPMLPHVQEIPDGQASVVLSVPILSTTRAQEKGFYVGIEEADGGAQIGARSLTQITLPATE